jgi:hypothetical protein
MREKYLRDAICNGEEKRIYRKDTHVNERFKFNHFVALRVWLIHSLTLETPIIQELISTFSKKDLVNASIPEAVIFPNKLKLVDASSPESEIFPYKLKLGLT